MKDLRVIKIVKEIKFEEVWDKLESKTGFQRQSVTKYLRLILVFVSCEMVHYGKSLIYFFQDFFARTALLALNMSIQRLILLPGFGTIAN